MLDSHFDPKTAEPRIFAAWEKSGAFEPKADPQAEPYCIMIPPPNVTGSLHIGHALNNTLQDIIARFERMRGKAVLWQPGTDHAGIATQMVVERQLAQSGRNEDRRSLGREAFVERVWEWKAQSGGAIIQQLKRLGASCAYARERFTMDEGLSAAVRTVFVRLYKEGLIYRDKRLVNWDPHFETAISDLEVVNTEVNGHMWHFKYPLAGGATYEHVERDADGNVRLREQRDYIAIATTRPETMLGDGAIAVHPSDERYASIVGKLCEIPVGPKAHRRLIPIIADEYPDPLFGSGAVKITGAHDFNDHQVAKRHALPCYRLLDTRGRLRTDGAPYAQEAAKAKAFMAGGVRPDARAVDAVNLCPDEYRGLDRYEARKRIVADIDSEGLMLALEARKIQQPFGDRSDVVIEPMLTDQWFVDAATLAGPALAAVETGATQFVPENWSKTYFQWLRNIEPWCVSRQLWWGHRIPAYYGPDGTIFVEESLAAAQEAARAHYGAETTLTQDEDVLDTWFSSALWPFSTLGWPAPSASLKRFYPTSTLFTAFDIIFFWVARMMMMGLHFTGEVPFRTVYIHALVLDAKGQKMSKSKGNVIDPLELVEEYGADALRFTLAAMAAQGRNIRLSSERIEGYRNFGTKLWNAARFCQMNECVLWEDFDPAALRQPVNQWLRGEIVRTAVKVTAELEALRFNEAAATLYRFIWNIFCDWHLELIKPLLQGTDEDAKVETRQMTAWALDQALKLLHPISPFLTEELWTRTAEFGRRRGKMLIESEWPDFSGLAADHEAEAEIDWLIGLISEIRSVRAELGVPAGARLAFALCGGGEIDRARLARYRELIERLGRLESCIEAEKPPSGSVQFVHDGALGALSIAGHVDVAAEARRLEKEIARVTGEIARLDAKLGNSKFTEKADPEVVEAEREKRQGYTAEQEKIVAALARLKGLA